MQVLISILSRGPWATMLVVALALVGGVVTVVDPAELNFEEYLTALVAAVAFLGVGRGLSATGPAVEPADHILDKIDDIPWATVLVVIITFVGCAVVVIGDAMTFDELFPRLAIAYGALGVGKGLANFKKDRDPLLGAGAGGENDAAFLAHPDHPANRMQEAEGVEGRETGGVAGGVAGGDEPPEPHGRKPTIR